MAAKAARVPVAQSAVPLWATSPGGGQSVLIRNGGTAPVDVGGPDVTAGAGFELQAGAALPVDLPPGEILYAVAASGTQSVHVLRTGVG